MSWGIVCDSSCNLRSYAPKTPGLEYRYAPLKITVDGVEYVDDEHLDVDELNRRVSESTEGSSSSCPNAGEWAELFRQYDNVIAITISSNLSASYKAAELGRDMVLEEDPDKNVFLLDSRATGGKMEVIVSLIDEYVAAGHSFEETCLYASNLEQSSQVLFSLSSYENLVKAGRMPKLAGTLASRLSIRMLGIASSEGTIKVIGPTRGDRKTLAKIVSSMVDCGYDGGRVSINHVNNLKAAEALRDLVHGTWPEAIVGILPCGGLCSYYAELSGLIVGFEWLTTRA